MKLTRLSENLYSLRKKRGLSQEEFAEKIHISRQAVSKWERGEAYPDTENLIEIAAFYGVTLDELVSSSDISVRSAAVTGAASHHEADDSDEDPDDTDKDEEGLTIVITDDDEDEEDEEDDNGGVTVEGKLHFNWYDLPYPIIVTAVYLLLGFLTPRGWEIWWTLYVTIPIYYSVIDCIRKRRLSPFAYPVFTAFVYLFVGVLFGIWHPTWIVFVTVPVYYSVAGAIDFRREKKKSLPKE